MRYLIAAALALCCASSGCMPQDTNKIESLTAKEAAELVTTANKPGYEPVDISLNGLTSIDKDVARELGKCRWSLFLNGLTSIDKDVAQELAKVKGRLFLRDLTSIDKDVAQELAKVKGSLFLDGLTSIDKDVAQELAKHGGEDLYLGGLTSIDKDVAQELAKHGGEELSLRDLKSIDLGTAVSLARCKERLDLSSLGNFYEPSIARALSNYSGPELLLNEKSLEKDRGSYPSQIRNGLRSNSHIYIRYAAPKPVSTFPVKEDIPQQNNGLMGTILAVLIVGLPIYFLPVIVAINKKKKQEVAIGVLNLFLGWTFIGWVVALVWAVMED